MKIKIFESETKYGLENKINTFIKDKHPDEVYDIKYSGCGAVTAHSIELYSAMIILK